MTDEAEEQERVVMVWPKALKDAVREVAGPRGLTGFVTTAVERHLKLAAKDAETEDPAPEVVRESVEVIDTTSPETTVSENEQPSEVVPPVVHPPVSRSEEPALDRLDPNHLNQPAGSEPVDLPHDMGTRDDLFARMMAKTGGSVDVDSLKAVLKPASEIPKPDPKCPKCGEALIDGECWTCD